MSGGSFSVEGGWQKMAEAEGRWQRSLPLEGGSLGLECMQIEKDKARQELLTWAERPSLGEVRVRRAEKKAFAFLSFSSFHLNLLTSPCPSPIL